MRSILLKKNFIIGFSYYLVITVRPDFFDLLYDFKLRGRNVIRASIYIKNPKDLIITQQKSGCAIARTYMDCKKIKIFKTLNIRDMPKGVVQKLSDL